MIFCTMQRFKIKAVRKTFDPESNDLEQESIAEEELEEDLVDATATFRIMTVNASTTAKEWSNGFVYPYLIYSYVDNRLKKLSIDIIVMCLKKKYFT